MTWFLAGAALGVAGSLHCAGMCGPLLLVIHGPLPQSRRVPRIALYHGARIVVYALLGVPAGWREAIGRSAPASLNLNLAAGDDAG